MAKFHVRTQSVRYVSISVHVCMYVCMDVCSYEHMYVCTYVGLYVCMYAGRYVRMYVVYTISTLSPRRSCMGHCMVFPRNNQPCLGSISVASSMFRSVLVGTCEILTSHPPGVAEADKIVSFKQPRIG